MAWGSSHVEAGIAVAVHLHSSAVTISGGVVIDVTQMDLTDLRTWLAYAGVKVDEETGRARLFKAVDADLNAGYCHAITRYPIGETVTAPDWDPVQECGYGLHFGVSPAHALRYFQGTTGSGSARFLEVEVDAAGLVPLGDKAKAQSCLVVREVTLHGEPVEVTE